MLVVCRGSQHGEVDTPLWYAFFGMAWGVFRVLEDIMLHALVEHPLV